MIFLHGAHVASWTPAGGNPILWLSDASSFRDGAPIRGGVPICFPWFGLNARDPSAPRHGFARLSSWTLLGAGESGDSVSVTLGLTDSERSRASVWPYRFEARYTVSIGAELSVTLEVTNTDTVEVTFEDVLHSYFAVADIATTRIRGLEGLPFFENDAPRATEEIRPMNGRGEISRRYPDARGGIIEDLGNAREIHVNASGARGTVVWNPGAAIAATMEDFTSDGWKGMLCLENGNIADATISLQPGQSHRTRVTITVT
ncbi:MAG: D-hexose-6-phosphate mutarotase [Hymenobacter sp.]|nr:D-hexose-6-phosphate mutarotase [Hymenobacter sp.]